MLCGDVTPLHDVIQRLVEAENEVRSRLENADREAARIVAEAREKARARVEAAQPEASRLAEETIQAAVNAATAENAAALRSAHTEAMAQSGWNEDQRQRLVSAVVSWVGGDC